MGKAALLVLILSVQFVPMLARASSDTSSRLQAFQVYYAGKKEQTFSNDNPGVGVELSASTINETFNWVAKGRLTQVAGTQKFDDGGSSTSSAFTFYQSSFEGGFTIYPLKKKKRSLNLYFGGTGIMSFNYLKLDSKSLTNLNPSYQATSFGYSGVVGVEWYLFKSDRWCFTAEFAQVYQKVNLVKKSNFSLDGFLLGAGFAW